MCAESVDDSCDVTVIGDEEGEYNCAPDGDRFYCIATATMNEDCKVWCGDEVPETDFLSSLFEF